MDCRKIFHTGAGNSVGRYRPEQQQPTVKQTPVAGSSQLAEPEVGLKPRRSLESWAEGGDQTEQRRTGLERIKKASADRRKDVSLSRLGLRCLPGEMAEELKHARKLDLSENNLASLTHSIGKLTKLVSLDLSANKPLSKLPKTIGQLKNLRKLNLRGNGLSTLTAAIGSIHDLTYLYVDGNVLTGLPEALGNLKALQVFTASHNLIANHLPSELKDLENLRKLDLSNNQIWSLPPQWDKLFTHLQEANLSSNRLQALPESFKLPPKSISMDLDVSNNPIRTLPDNYGGFTYKWQSDDNIASLGNHLTVNTANTDIRQGLVNVGRLKEGRGIYRDGDGFKSEDKAMPRAPFEDDLRSEISVERYVRENQELGGVEGLEYAAQHAGEFMDEPTRRRDELNGWVGGLADRYGNHYPGKQDLPPEVAVQRPSGGGWPTLSGVAPPGGYPVRPSFLANDPGPSFAPQAAWSNIARHPTGADAEALLDARLNELHHRLEALPPEVSDAVLATLDGLPKNRIVAKLPEILAVLEEIHLSGPSPMASHRPETASASRPAQAFAQRAAPRPVHVDAPFADGRRMFPTGGGPARGAAETFRNPLDRPQQRPMSPPPWERPIPERTGDMAQSSGMHAAEGDRWTDYNYLAAGEQAWPTEGGLAWHVEDEQVSTGRPIRENVPENPVGGWLGDYLWNGGEKPY